MQDKKRDINMLFYCTTAHSPDILLARVQSMASLILIFYYFLNFCNLLIK